MHHLIQQVEAGIGFVIENGNITLFAVHGEEYLPALRRIVHIEIRGILLLQNDAAAMASGKFSSPAQNHAPPGPQDDRKRRTPGREGWPGVESAQSGDYGIL